MGRAVWPPPPLAEAAGDEARPPGGPSVGRLVVVSTGMLFACASGEPYGLGRTPAGSRYHCSAVAAAEVRSRRAAGSGRFGPAAEAAGGPKGPSSARRRSAGPVPPGGGQLAVPPFGRMMGGFSFVRRGWFWPALLWPHRFGADPRPGRATNAPSPARRRSGSPRPAWRRARGRFRPGGRSGGRAEGAVVGATAVRRPRPAGRRATSRTPFRPDDGGFSFVRRGWFWPALLWPHRFGADPRPGRATTAPSPARRRSGLSFRAGSFGSPSAALSTAAFGADPGWVRPKPDGSARALAKSIHFDTKKSCPSRAHQGGAAAHLPLRRPAEAARSPPPGGSALLIFASSRGCGCRRGLGEPAARRAE